MSSNVNYPLLLVHCRRGLFQMTICQSCNYKFQCENCDCNLTTYRSYETNMQLICNQCQSYYNYPKICPSCQSTKLDSVFGGIEDLVETVAKEYNEVVYRFDNLKVNTITLDQANIMATTRIFDPAIDYTIFQTIVFVQADNLLSSADYLVSEDTHQALANLLLSIESKTKVVFDTQDPESFFWRNLARLNSQHQEPISILEWFSQFVQIESNNRNKYDLPPFHNLILLTTQNKNKDKSLQQIQATRQYLNMTIRDLGLQGVELGSIYQARFFRRKGYFSHHLLVRYPKQYQSFFELSKIVKFIASTHNLQVRLNPRHLF